MLIVARTVLRRFITLALCFLLLVALPMCFELFVVIVFGCRSVLCALSFIPSFLQATKDEPPCRKPVTSLPCEKEPCGRHSTRKRAVSSRQSSRSSFARAFEPRSSCSSLRALVSRCSLCSSLRVLVSHPRDLSFIALVVCTRRSSHHPLCALMIRHLYRSSFTHACNPLVKFLELEVHVLLVVHRIRRCECL